MWWLATFRHLASCAEGKYVNCPLEKQYPQKLYHSLWLHFIFLLSFLVQAWCESAVGFVTDNVCKVGHI